MPRTLAVMLTCTTYGTWLRGDPRGYVDDSKVLPPNPTLHAADTARLKHPPYTFPPDRLLDTAHAIGQSLIDRKNQRLLALSLQTWHVHALVTATRVPIPDLVKCLKDAARYHLRPGRPIWTTGYDKRFCFEEQAVHARTRYIERHNEQNGWPPRPFPFLDLPT
ncbi:MAG: hypothetical protein AAFY08_02965 [Planctomycetota bacterium]